ncbi:energy-coupling factor transporter transmembrane component T family protein [Vagococcus zengguangii]|uniref:Energy-coupling factor transporter transmembrane protein EcfT n=1 Tax=Vagococcus zengguangii TaxID=2571750 RepID=A0A4D7CTU0_9ENTE|nr:energy-coupling factor transporter transmembrane component T [Vagococcus zengguangii]QCI85817.1 energy-coupling factor transporter transmembrane protein EcfT [Vagococcus zengguangii]TLG81758.1 energy-coupling factor transporter transmembrane protein EcfT [Vagococcus zengguangii]
MRTLSVKFDPRSKLVTVLFASLLLMFRFDLTIELAFMTLLFLLFCLEGSWKRGLFYYLSCLFILWFSDWLLNYINQPFITFISFGFIVLRRFFPTIMAAGFAANKTKTSQWIATLKKWHFPFSIIVPLAVLFRFFPTFMQDFKHLHNAMKFRGIVHSYWDLIRHPFRTIEHLVVPLLMSTENISLDLSAASLTRGLGNPAPQSSIYPIKFAWYDYLLCLVIILLGIGGFTL